MSYSKTHDALTELEIDVTSKFDIETTTDLCIIYFDLNKVSLSELQYVHDSIVKSGISKNVIALPDGINLKRTDKETLEKWIFKALEFYLSMD